MVAQIGVNRHLINALILSFAFFGIFVAYSTVQNLESSLLKDNMGQYSLAALYAAFCVSALFISTPVTSLIPPKWSLIIGGASYIPLIAANLYPIWGTLIPAAVILGLGAGILWAAQGSYLTAAGANYAESVQQPVKSAMGIFNGIFFCIFQGTQVIGNTVSSIILMWGGNSQAEARRILFITFLIIASLGVALFWILGHEESQADKGKQADAEQRAFKKGALSDDEEDGYSGAVVEGSESAISKTSKNLGRVLMILLDPKCFLMIPCTLYSGMEQSFVFSDFTTDVIKPAKGVEWIGFILAVFGACDSLGSVIMGKLGDKFSKTLYLLVGTISHLMVYIFFILFWWLRGADATIALLQDNIVVLFVIAGVLGVADSCWCTFPPIIASVMFIDNTEAAFSNLKFWQALGSVCVFVWSPLLDFKYKVIIYAAVLLFQVACVLYLHLKVQSLDSMEHSKQLTQPYEDITARSINNDRKLN